MKLSRTTLLTAVLIIAALAIGTVVNSRLPKPDDVFSAPFVRAGTFGLVVKLRTGEVTLTSLKLTHKVSRFGTTYDNPNVWVVVNLQFTPRQRSMTLTRPSIVAADGRRFGGDQPIASPCGPAQPDFTLSCNLILETTTDALPGARLEIMADPMSGPRTPDDMAVFALDYTEQSTAAELATAQTIELGSNTEIGAR